MLKLAAAVLVICGSTGMGFYYCFEMKRRIRDLREIMQILLMMQKEISYNRLPLSEVCLRAGERATEPYGNFLCGIHKQMQQFPGSSFAQLWGEGLWGIAKKTALQDSDIRLIQGIADDKGFSDGSMQIQKISFQIGEVEELIRHLKQSEENKSRLYICIGIMGGILCTILFI